MEFLGKEIGSGKLPFIVAEISCNHEGDLSQAKKLIEIAKDNGADAAKIQVYTPDDMTINVEGVKAIVNGFEIVQGPWAGQSLYELYTKTQTTYEMARELILYAESIQFPIFASVFSPYAGNYVKVPAYKIASFELPDTFMIRRLAKEGKPMVLSTGMANIQEIDDAVACCDPKNLILLHCVSAYPTKIETCNLHRIKTLGDLFSVPVGFSDHTRGVTAGPLAAALGAVMLEKHLALEGTHSEDEKFSLHYQEFRYYAAMCREAAKATFKSPIPDENSSRQFRRSLYVIKDMEEGDAFTAGNIKAIRPSYGMEASQFTRIISGHKASMRLKAGTPLRKEHLS